MLANNATLVVGAGNYFLGPVGTKAPDDLRAPDAPWENMGHTSIEDIMALSSEGGEAKTLGTLQAPQLRTSYSTRTETMRVVLQQFDDASLKLFFGANSARLESDSRFLAPSSSPSATQAAFMAVYVDGANTFALWSPSVEILRGDDFEIPDTESLVGLPLDIKPMYYVPPGSQVANTWTWALTPLQAAPNASGATAGNPGSFSPAGATAPGNLQLLGSVKASPTSAWTTGQHVVLGDKTTAYWDGSTWRTGKAA